MLSKTPTDTLKLSFESLLFKIFARVDLPDPDKPVNQRILVISGSILNVFSYDYVYHIYIN